VPRGNGLVKAHPLISGTGRCVRAIAAGTDIGDLGSPRLQVTESELLHDPSDAFSLMLRINGIQSDLADPPFAIQDCEHECDQDAFLFNHIDLRRRIGIRNLAEAIGILLLAVVISVGENIGAQRFFQTSVNGVNADMQMSNTRS
jgi:hypothetical protein